MGHNIEKAERGSGASVFVVGKPAWHRLGTVLTAPATAEEAIQYANLDFIVKKFPIFTQIRDGNKVLIEEVIDRYATVRTDINIPLGIVGGTYTPIQNRDAFKFFDPLVGEGSAIYHSAGVLGKGERVWIMAKLPDYIRIGKDDDVSLNVILTNSHDGSGALLALLSPVRVVCQNTLNFAINNHRGMVKVRHTVNANYYMQEAHRVLGIMVDQSKLLEKAFKRLTEITIKAKFEERFVNFCIPSEKLDKPSTIIVKNREALYSAIHTAPGCTMQSAKGTAWGLFNGYTYYLDYVVRTKDDSRRLHNIWFGDFNRAKTKAIEFLLTEKI